MRTVFLDRSTIEANINLSAITTQIDSISYFENTLVDKIIFRAKFAEVIITNKVRLDRSTLSRLSKLKLICIAATGTNNVDLIAAKELGIAVCNVPSYSSSSVSQYVFSMLLELLQRTSRYINNTRQQHWQNSPIFCHFNEPINELCGKTLAIIGYGEIAKSVEVIGKAFGMKVVIAERQGATTIRANRLAFNQAISCADIISLHCPLTNSTEGLINAETLAQCKPGAILINTARGGLINNQHLLHALKCKRLGGAILDVLEQEPPPSDHILLNTNLENLLITAHIAWGSLQAQQRLIDAIGENIASFAQAGSLNRVI